MIDGPTLHGAVKVSCSALTPEAVLQTSGHVEKFTDFMVKVCLSPSFSLSLNLSIQHNLNKNNPPKYRTWRTATATGPINYLKT